MTTTTPSPEQSARKLLSIFAEKNIRAGEILMAGHVQMAFQRDTRFRASDYSAGAQYAHERNWLQFSATTVKLLEEGAEEAMRS
ncbi:MULTISPECIES: hypothetical protein [unclassified Bradyrhizobium]|uniref:hypothetical protein n=1 Tax=unclassified Bradyrhizobium TaxID=2631580 RepID=UPI002915F317|nr:MULTISPECIES: hypothetical protein [unclassified Bradyrhizobium]